jgi:PAS domain S-box-containing protein
MIDEIKKLRELTETLTGNGYLKDQAEEWEYAFDAIPDYVYLVDVEYKLKHINKALEDRLGKKKEEVGNQLCYKVIGSDDCVGPIDPWKKVPPSKEAKAHDVYLKNLNGWFDMTRSPIFTKTGKIMGFICVLQDVTEKRKALKDLVAREATLETIFNAAPIGMGMLRADRVILSVNKFFLDMMGYREEEVVGQNARMFYISDEEFERVGKLKHASIRKTGIGALETKFKRKDGSVLNVYLRTSAIVGSTHMVFTVTDITERKVRERRIKLNEDRLESVLELSTMDDLPEEDIVEYALEEAVRLTNSEVGYLHFVTQPGDDLSDVNLSLFKWSKKVHEKCTARKTPHYPLTSAGCWADCVRTGKPVVHNDYEALTPEHGKKGLPDGHFPIKRHMSVPVLEDGKVVAVAGVGNKLTPYNRADLRQLNLFMNNMWDILSKKQAREQVVRSKEYFERLISNTPIGVFVYSLIDGDLILIHFNSAGEEILNISSEEIIGSSISDAFPALKDTELVNDYIDIALGGDPISISAYPYQDHRIDGVFTVFAFNSGEGEIAVFFTDATEKEKLFQQIQESEQKYRLIAENLEDVIWTFDTDMKFTFVSSPLEELMGYDPSEWIGHDLSEFATEEDFAYMASQVLEAISDPKFRSITFQSKMLHKDGRNLPIEINAKPIYVEDKLVGFQGRTRVLKHD